MPYNVHKDFLAGLKEATVAAAGIIPFAMLVGLTMIKVGYSGAQVVFMSAVMFSGAAQLTAIELLAGGSTPVVVVIAALTVNSRFMMFSASIAPYFAGFSMRVRWLFAFILADLHYALTMAKYREDDISLFWYYFGSALSVYLIWVFSTLLGVLIGAQIPETLELNFAVSLVFIYLLLSLVDGLVDIAVALISGSLAVAMSWLPHDAELLITPLIAVLVAYVLRRKWIDDE